MADKKHKKDKDNNKEFEFEEVDAKDYVDEKIADVDEKIAEIENKIDDKLDDLKAKPYENVGEPGTGQDGYGNQIDEENPLMLIKTKGRNKLDSFMYA